jgi:hypothetical protein
MDLWSVSISFLPLFFLGSLFFLVGTDVVNNSDLHGLSTGYFDANCTAEQNAGLEAVYCVGVKCKTEILCCDYPVSIIPTTPLDPNIVPFLNGSHSFSEFLSRRACGYPNPCSVYRATLSEDADPTFFSCKFSPEKLTNKVAASVYCPSPQNDPRYFGECPVVSYDEFDILQAADDLQGGSRPFFYVMQLGGALLLLISVLYGCTALCCICQNRKTMPEEATTSEQTMSDAPYYAFK